LRAIDAVSRRFAFPNPNACFDYLKTQKAGNLPRLPV
jgi:hypothetical protein